MTTRWPRIVLALFAASLAAALAASCSAPQRVEAPPKAATAPGDVSSTDQGAEGKADAAPTSPQQQPFGVGTLLPDADFERAEKELSAALDGKDAAGQPLSTGDRCSVVCKALASMRRSADEICKLDAQRCTDVRGRVTKAEQRAKDACPACASPT